MYSFDAIFLDLELFSTVCLWKNNEHAHFIIKITHTHYN